MSTALRFVDAPIPDSVVLRYAFKNGLSEKAAKSLFDALLSFLDTAALGPAVSPTPSVDSAWHEFILHTQDYAAFCDGRYGHFIHHVPTSPRLATATSPESRQMFRSAKCQTKQCSTRKGDTVALGALSCETKCSSDCKSGTGENG